MPQKQAYDPNTGEPISMEVALGLNAQEDTSISIPRLPGNQVAGVNTSRKRQRHAGTAATLPATPNPTKFETSGRRLGFMPTAPEASSYLTDKMKGFPLPEPTQPQGNPGQKQAYDPDTGEPITDPMNTLSKAESIGPHIRTWRENLASMIPAVPTTMLGRAAGTAIGGFFGGPPGALVGGYVGGVAGAGVGTGIGDYTIANPISQHRRGVTQSTEQDIDQAKTAAISGAVGEGIGAPVAAGVTAIAKKAYAPFASKMTVMGQQILDRFKTPAGSTRTAVMPSHVTDSTLANAAENAGRNAVFGGEPFKEATKLAREVERQEVSKELVKTGARGLPTSPATLKLDVNRSVPATFGKVQAQIKSNVTGAEKVGTALYDKAHDLADKAGLFTAEGRRLKDLGDDYKDLNLTWRMLRDAARMDPNKKAAAADAFNALQMRRQEIDDLVAKNPNIAAAWEQARNNWRAMRAKYNPPVITGIMNSTPDNIGKALVTGTGLETTPGLGGRMLDNRQLVRAVLRAAPEQKKAVKNTIIRSLISDAVNSENYDIYGSHLKENLIKSSETLQPLLGPEYLGWLHLAEMLEFKQASNLDIGRMFWQMRQPQAAAQLLSGKPSFMTGTLLAAPAILSRIMTNPKATEWLTTGLKLGPDTEAGIKVLSRIAPYLASHAFLDEDNAMDDTDPFADQIDTPPNQIQDVPQ